MRVTVQGLQRWIVVTGSLLLALIAVLIIYGRNRFRHIEKDLPARLGVNIQQTANGFSYTQTSQGHALFTLKASKELQLKSGHVLLHDVDVTLYGPPGSGRTDRIYGSDFDYDQNKGIISSQGEVNIELQGTENAAPPPPDSAASSAPSSDPTSNTIRVRTHGLTFMQKTGEATTSQQVQFQLPRAAGTAIGADYSSKTGVVVLISQVHMTTSSNGKAAVVEAAQATLLRASDQAFLVSPVVNYETEQGSSNEATVWFRKDGTTQKIDARGRVHMKTDDGATVDADIAHILMDAKSQPTQADLAGGVRFASGAGNEAMHGSADNGTLLFATAQVRGGSQTALRHGEFRRDVNFEEDLTALPRDPHGREQKTMHAEKVDVDFAPPSPGGSVEARKAVGEGNPVITLLQVPSKGPQQTTRISGDQLIALLDPGNALRQLDGAGNTQIVQSTSDGSRNTTKGDILNATFVQTPPVPRPGNPAAPPMNSESSSNNAEKKPKQPSPEPRPGTTLEAANQDGHVMLTETPAKKPGSAAQPATLTGWAGHAEYHASDQILHLTGSPRIADGDSMQVAAEHIDYHRDTQDAAALGNVKATYTQQQKPAAAQQTAPPIPPPNAPTLGGNGPVHVIAERAAMDHATNQNFFYGTPQKPARMWQDANSLLAPVIEIDRNQNLLKAWGENTGNAAVVNANFTSSMGANHEQSVVRVHSQTLNYSDKTRQGDFRGNVTAEQSDQIVHADDALLFLKATPPSSKPGQAPSTPAQSAPPSSTTAPVVSRQNSQLDHLIASGHVVFTQPGRKGDSEKLVYTADDGTYIMTGTEAAPPHMWDRVHGTTTGAALIFNTQDDSVEVSGGKSSAVTETRARK